MGLKDLGDDDLNKPSSSSKKYVRPDIDDMQEFFDARPEYWRIDHEAKANEVVVETKDFAPDSPNVVLRCFTTIDKGTRKARGKGADAIRLVVWNKQKRRPMGGRKKTLRIKTWRKNLGDKIDDLMAHQKDYTQMCDECGSWMVIRDGKYGEFYGCSNYPECDNTMEIEE